MVRVLTIVKHFSEPKARPSSGEMGSPPGAWFKRHLLQEAFPAHLHTPSRLHVL